MLLIADVTWSFVKGILTFGALIGGGIIGLALALLYAASAGLLLLAFLALVLDYTLHLGTMHLALSFITYAAVAFAIPGVIIHLPAAIGAAVARYRVRRLRILPMQSQAWVAPAGTLQLTTDAPFSRRPDAVAAALHRLNTAV